MSDHLDQAAVGPVEAGQADVVDKLDELHRVSEVTDLDTSGTERGFVGQIHPLGWIAAALMIADVVGRFIDSERLVGNFKWWHWVGLALLAVASIRPSWIKGVSRFIDRVTDWVSDGANSFKHPWSGFVVSVSVVALAGLAIGPLRGLADWIFGVEVNDIGGGDFEVLSSGNAGWIRSAIAAAVLFVAGFALKKALEAALPDGKISLALGGQMAAVVFVATVLIVGLTDTWSNGVVTGFGLAVLIAGLAFGPLWSIAWGIFFTIFVYVVTRYTARFLAANIIIGELNSLGLALFALLALLGLGYGVKAGVNPRIDFWWAEFSNRRKAWLDFVLHALFLVPFLWAGIRLLLGFAKNSLGFARDFSGETDGDWPASWHVWETWNQASDAGNLPVGPIRAMIFVAFVLFLAQIISEMIKGGFVLIRREDLADLKVTDAPARVE